MAAAENASYSQRMSRDGFPFSGREIRETFLKDGSSIGDTILRSVFDDETAHLTAMQIQQGLRVLRTKAKTAPEDLPARVREYAILPPALQAAIVDGLVSAAKDGSARQEALLAWGGGSLAMAKRRNIGHKYVRPSAGGERFA
jgi:hypothetical protein